VPNDELQAIANSWRERGEDYELFTRDPDIRATLEREHIIRIGYRALRNLQRREHAAPHK